MFVDTYKPMMEVVRKHDSDSMVLKLAVLVHRDRLEERNEYTQERVNTLKKLIECAENGRVAVIESGMDCDCVQYTGHVHDFPSDTVGFYGALADMYSWAEGPISWRIVKPSESHFIERTSRDLIMEAHENGHPHVVYC